MTSGPADRDPRLELPEVLRSPPRPVDIPGRPQRPTGDGFGSTAKAWGIALDFVFTILAGLLLGWLADHWRATTPLWSMVGLSAGFVVAFIRIVRYTQRAELRERRERESRMNNPEVRR